MPPLAHEIQKEAESSPPGQRLAVTAESLYLINLLLVPGVAFALLLLLWWRNREAPPLARCHLRQTLVVSLWAGGLLGIFSALVVLLAGYEFAHTWLFVLLYFTTFHSLFVLLGMLGLAKAMAGKLYRYPIFGVSCPEMEETAR
ncbi:MAG: hypothetical protein Kow006_04150 [Gammaproteobacteria bacterium]